MKTSFSVSCRIGFALVVAGSWPSGTNAQSGAVDATFNAETTIGETGFSVAVQPDYKVIAVGSFGVRRFLADGAIDPSFRSIPPGPSPWTGPGSGIGAVVLQPDGRILISGTFTNAVGEPLPAIVRLLPDGSIDPSFQLDSQATPVGMPLLQSDGKIVTAGVYYDSVRDDYGGLIRLQSDGSLDRSFDARGISASPPLALAPDGKIYFTSDRIARANTDGTLDDTFTAELGSYPPNTLVVQPDGKLLVGQYVEASYMRRLLPDGREDPDWIKPEISGGDAVIQSILLQPDGKILVGGNNVYDATIGRLNPDGAKDPTFDSRGDLYSYAVEDMALAPDGRIVVAGFRLDRPNITAAPGVWRLTNDPSLQPQLEIGLTANDGISLRLRGPVGATYRLEYREQLSGSAPGSWTSLTTVTLSGDSVTVQDPGWTKSTMRFYRGISL
jgi:uncharacterized delta-60 repeat protein